ncbi:MAG: GAF domain-containing protein [Bacteroidota bacterium]|nr:GAF domain-containing protein [Bacteroidota bacterium]
MKKPDSTHIPFGKRITGHAAITGKAALVRETSKDPRIIENNNAGLSKICVPIICEDILYGLIDCEHPEKGYFTGRHLKLLSAIASIYAIEINLEMTPHRSTTKSTPYIGT